MKIHPALWALKHVCFINYYSLKCTTTSRTHTRSSFQLIIPFRSSFGPRGEVKIFIFNDTQLSRSTRTEEAAEYFSRE